MVEITRMVAFYGMASPAQGAHIPDKTDFFVSCGLFVRFGPVAIQAHAGVKGPIGPDLPVGVQGLIRLLIMTTVAEIQLPGVGRPSQGIAVKPAFDALPIDIMAGAAGQFPALQRKVRRRDQCLDRSRIDIQRVAVSRRHAMMTFSAERLIVAFVFQKGVPSFNRCSLVAVAAIPSGKVDIDIFIGDRGFRRRHWCSGRCLLMQWQTAQE